MPILSAEEREQIFQSIREKFDDCTFFNELLTRSVRAMIEDFENTDFSYVSCARLVSKHFDTQDFQTAERRTILNGLTIVLKSCFILLFSYRPEAKRLMFKSVDELLQHYPGFCSCDPYELELLLRFRNIMKVSFSVIPARQNKHMLLKIASRLEGAHREYIMGGGQRKEVDRRVHIFHHESGLPENKRSQLRNDSMHKQEAFKPAAIALSPKQAHTIGNKRISPTDWSNLFTTKVARLNASATENLSLPPHHPGQMKNTISLTSHSDSADCYDDLNLLPPDLKLGEWSAPQLCSYTDMEVGEVLFHDSLEQEMREPDIELLASGERGYSQDNEFKLWCSSLETGDAADCC